MEKVFVLRLVKESDWKILLEWRDDIITRKNSFNSENIKKSEHIQYLKDTIKNPNRNLFLLLLNKIPVGTIREDIMEPNKYELSYTISPQYRGQKLGQLMMNIYLFNKKGSFYCEVKKENVPSIKMIKKLGFKYFRRKNDINHYKLEK